MSAILIGRHQTAIRISRTEGDSITIIVFACDEPGDDFGDMVLFATALRMNCSVRHPPAIAVPTLQVGDVFIPIENEETAIGVEAFIGRAAHDVA